MNKINPETVKLFKEFKAKDNTRWNLANQILYKMCEDYPYHKNDDEIVAKLWIIGRTYAAALERRKK